MVKVMVLLVKDQSLKFAKELHNGVQDLLCKFQVVLKELGMSNDDKVKWVTKDQDKLIGVKHHAKLMKSFILDNVA